MDTVLIVQLPLSQDLAERLLYWTYIGLMVLFILFFSVRGHAGGPLASQLKILQRDLYARHV